MNNKNQNDLDYKLSVDKNEYDNQHYEGASESQRKSIGKKALAVFLSLMFAGGAGFGARKILEKKAEAKIDNSMSQIEKDDQEDYEILNGAGFDEFKEYTVKPGDSIELISRNLCIEAKIEPTYDILQKIESYFKNINNLYNHPENAENDYTLIIAGNTYLVPVLGQRFIEINKAQPLKTPEKDNEDNVSDNQNDTTNVIEQDDNSDSAPESPRVPDWLTNYYDWEANNPGQSNPYEADFNKYNNINPN